MDDPTDRLMRLLTADFRYKENVDGAVWLDHARPQNGRVIFYPDGTVDSIEHTEFAAMEIEETDRFNRFTRFIKPATTWERFTDWVLPALVWPCLFVIFGAGWCVIWLALHVLRAVWRG